MVQNRPKVEAVAEVLGNADAIKNEVVVQVGTRAINLINNTSTLENAVSIMMMTMKNNMFRRQVAEVLEYQRKYIDAATTLEGVSLGPENADEENPAKAKDQVELWQQIAQLYIDGEEAADAERWIMKQARIIHVLAPSEQALKIGY